MTGQESVKSVAAAATTNKLTRIPRDTLSEKASPKQLHSLHNQVVNTNVWFNSKALQSPKPVIETCTFQNLLIIFSSKSSCQYVQTYCEFHLSNDLFSAEVMPIMVLVKYIEQDDVVHWAVLYYIN